MASLEWESYTIEVYENNNFEKKIKKKHFLIIKERMN